MAKKQKKKKQKKKDKVKELSVRLEACSDPREKRKLRRKLRKLGSPRRVRRLPRIIKIPVTEPVAHLMTALQQFHNVPKYHELLALIIIDQSCRAASLKYRKSWDYVKREAHRTLNQLIKKYQGKKSHRHLLRACGGSLPKSMFKET